MKKERNKIMNKRQEAKKLLEEGLKKANRLEETLAFMHLKEYARQALAALESESDLLKNFLAVIHGDGGHHTADVGLEQSVKDAQQIYYQLRDKSDVCKICGGSGNQYCPVHGTNSCPPDGKGCKGDIIFCPKCQSKPSKFVKDKDLLELLELPDDKFREKIAEFVQPKPWHHFMRDNKSADIDLDRPR